MLRLENAYLRNSGYMTNGVHVELDKAIMLEMPEGGFINMHTANKLGWKINSTAEEIKAKIKELMG